MENNNRNNQCEGRILPLWAAIVLGSIGVGAVITTAVTCIFGGFDETVRRYIIWIAASVLFGLASWLVFGKDKFSLPVATVLHAVICFIIVVGATYLCRFDGGFGANILSIAIVFIVVYVAIYLVTYIASKNEAMRINKKLMN